MPANDAGLYSPEDFTTGTSSGFGSNTQNLLDKAYGLSGMNANANGNNPLSVVSPWAAQQTAIDYANDPYGYAARTSYLTNQMTGGANSVADITKYQLGGDPNAAQNYANQEFLQAGAAGQRAAPVLDQSGTGFVQNTLNALGMRQMQGAMNGGEGQGLVGKVGNAQMQLGQQGQGSGLMGQAGQGLLAYGQMPAGPSVAERAMQQQGDAAMRQQASLAASARGGGSALALQNAATNAANIGVGMNQNLGIQRAQEDMANRQFAANSLNSAANVFGNQSQLQQNALAGAGGTYAGQNAFQQNAYNNVGNSLNNAGQLAFNSANAQAGLQAGQNQLNDQTAINRTQIGYGLLGQQMQGNIKYDEDRTGNHLGLHNADFANRDRTGEGTITGSAGWDKLIGAGASTGGAVLAMSDIRGKKNISPAGDQVSDAFRTANRDADYMRSGGASYPELASARPTYAYPYEGLAQPQRQEISRADPYPAYSYDYKDPNAPGAEPGQQFGPMAQDLEKTPAGKSVVSTGKDGKKRIDAGRLTLMNASETSKLRGEVDRLKADAAAREPNLGQRLGLAMSNIGAQLGQRADYPVVRQPGGYTY